MTNHTSAFPHYGFEQHVGYGTAFHRKKIAEYGLSKLHRKSFCRGIRIDKVANLG